VHLDFIHYVRFDCWKNCKHLMFQGLLEFDILFV
jgi:hypothetical protein